MTTVHDPALAHALANLAVADVLIGHRLITPDDAGALTPEEAASLLSRVPAHRQASGAARIVARQLMTQMGMPPAPLPKGLSGAPLWPSGMVGSLAHDDSVAIAAIARRTTAATLGIDIEPAGPLSADLLDVVATARERLHLERDPDAGRLLFAAKEAVYKAVNPLDGTFLEFHDINVDFIDRRATLRDGRTLRLVLVKSPRAIVLALP